jgi:hypothetical protein
VRVDELELEAGMPLGEHGRHVRQDRDQDRPEGRDPDPPGAQPDVRRQLGSGGVDAPDDLRRAFGEHLAGLGEPDAASDALEQLSTGLGLQSGEVVADRGLRVVQLLSGGRHRSVTGDGSEDAKAGDVEHSSMLPMVCQQNWH